MYDFKSAIVNLLFFVKCLENILLSLNQYSSGLMCSLTTLDLEVHDIEIINTVISLTNIFYTELFT